MVLLSIQLPKKIKAINTGGAIMTAEKKAAENTAAQANKITTVADYRTRLSIPRDITTPSGAVFKIRRLSPIDYIKEGMSDIPNEFFSFIMELSANAITEPDITNPEVKKNYEIFEQFLKITIEKGVIAPPIILKWDMEKEKTHLIFAELTPEDQKFIIDMITGRLIIT